MVGTFFLRIRAQNTYFIQNTYTIFDIPQFWQRLKRLQRFRAAFHTQYALLGLRRRPADKKLKPYNQSWNVICLDPYQIPGLLIRRVANGDYRRLRL